MAGDKFLTNNNGVITEKQAVQASAGGADAGKILALDANGRLDLSTMPTGVGPDTASIPASEALAAGDFVNVWSNGGAFAVRKADGSTSGKEAHGFILAAVANGASALVYFAGRNTQVTGAAPGVQFLSDVTPGSFKATAPTGTGKTVQRLGVAVSATEINFEGNAPIVLA
jgi:hypothetical protein